MQNYGEARTCLKMAADALRYPQPLNWKDGGGCDDLEGRCACLLPNFSFLIL